LQSTRSPSQLTIKKHGTDLYPCPQYIKPFPHVKSSDYQFGNIHKGITSHPYQNAAISEFNPATPWAAPAAYADLVMEPFPSLTELDAGYDSWPESGNPFLHDETAFPCGLRHKAPIPTTGYTNLASLDPATLSPLQLLSTSTTDRTFSKLVADIIGSNDKLFFIAHSPANQSRREWKLVQLDFITTMKLHPGCLQDGKFLVQYYIEHFNDSSVDLADKRYWLEYHSHENHKTLGVQYHLIPPSALSEEIARTRSLVPYREWVYLSKNENVIHGPFNFSNVHNRKTRDRISVQDWNLLIASRSQYDCAAPQFRRTTIQIATNEQPITLRSEHSVTKRIESFMFRLHFEDETLQTYGLS
jgi:hypothetical protein